MQKTYFDDQNAIIKNGKEGPLLLTNFKARITHQAIYHDGDRTHTMITIEGTLSDGTPLDPLTIPASDFQSMNWVAEKWGMVPIIYPHPSAERDVRTAIQSLSKPEKKHVYTHVGWEMIDGKPTYLSNGGGINADGYRNDLAIDLPNDLRRYSLPAPTANRDNWKASMSLSQMGKPSIVWPLLLAAYRAAMNQADFAVHLSGKTGTFKSEACSLFQSHWGDMPATCLPCSWSSTANAIEALAYKAAYALCVVDDFVPIGTSWQVRQLTAKADQIIRGQGNQAGRQRLSEVSSLQSTYYPRGILLSTGEDIPEGHSMRARCLLLDLTPGDIESGHLSTAQANRERYKHAMADWIHWLAQHPEKRVVEVQKYRPLYAGTGHARTPTTLANLHATAMRLGEWGVDRGYLTPAQQTAFEDMALPAIKEAGDRQKIHLESSDPTSAFIDTVQTLVGSKLGHFRTRKGGIPYEPERFGWEMIERPGEVPSYKPQGPRVGWIDRDEHEVYIDPGQMPLIKKFSGGRLMMTPQTLAKRLKDDGLITRTDDARDRNTVRLTLEGHPHNVMVLDIAQLFPDK